MTLGVPEKIARDFCSLLYSRVTLRNMITANQPNVKFVQTPDYRESYSNSVQIRVEISGISYHFRHDAAKLRDAGGARSSRISPQQAKALMALLQQNVTNYEAAFGEIKLDPRAPGGPVH